MPSMPPADESSHGHVLVVDDDLATRKFMKVQLEDAGFDVSIADSGERCLELAVSLLPEVIVLDLSMPGMTGIEACRRLRAGAQTHDIPVLFLTAPQDEERVVVRALEAGANDFLSKDSSRHVLAARLRTQVAISRAHYKLRELSLVDEVSRAWSKAYLQSTLRGAIKAMTREREPSLVCVVADVAGLEAVNKRHGFRGGDEVMRVIASALMSSTRETDVVSRLDGARFGVLLIDTTLENAQPVIERMKETTAQRTKLATVSFGIADISEVGVDDLRDADKIDRMVGHLIKRASLAARVAEREGEGSIVVGRESVPGEEPEPLSVSADDDEPTGAYDLDQLEQEALLPEDDEPTGAYDIEQLDKMQTIEKVLGDDEPTGAYELDKIKKTSTPPPPSEAVSSAPPPPSNPPPKRVVRSALGLPKSIRPRAKLPPPPRKNVDTDDEPTGPYSLDMETSKMPSVRGSSVRGNSVRGSSVRGNNPRGSDSTTAPEIEVRDTEVITESDEEIEVDIDLDEDSVVDIATADADVDEA